MFCSHCGNKLDPASRFCTACGAGVAAAGPFPTGTPFQRTSQLTRPRANRMIAGVCAGFALHYGWDLNLVRIITALCIVLTGVGVFAYIAAWVIIPEEPYALPVKST